LEVLVFIFTVVLVALVGALVGGVYAIYASKQNQ